MADVQLSVLLTLLQDFDALRKTITKLQAQTVRDQLEIIISTTHDKLAQIDQSMLQAFGAYQVVTLEHMETGSHAWAEGIKKARAPIVVLAEDHCFPPPHWAATLIDAHKSDYAAVCPAIGNGNPDSAISWANFSLTFLEWFAPEQSHEVDYAPGHNTSYKRDILMQYSDNLAYWFNPERVLHYDLRAKGYRLLLDARVTVSHVNISVLGGYVGHSFYGGRIFGDSRSKHWGIINKLGHTLGAPLVPVLRAMRIIQTLNTPQKRAQAQLMRAFRYILLGLCCHAVGEVVGYWVGMGDANDHYSNYELRRRDFVQPHERAQLLTST